MTVDDIVGGHDAPGLRLLHNDLKCLQIDLTDRTLTCSGVALTAVGLLVVQRKVLHGSSHMVALDSGHHGSCHLTGEHRILRVVLEVSAAERTSVDVDGGCQPCADIVLLCLSTAGSTYLLHDLRIPGTCKQSRAGECGGIHTAAGSDTHTCRSVCSHNIGHAVIRQVSVTEGIGNTGVGLSAEKDSELLIGQSGHKLIQGHSTLRHIDELGSVVHCAPETIAVPEANLRGHAVCLCAGKLGREDAGIGVELRQLGKLFKGTVGKQSLRQKLGNHLGRELLCDHILRKHHHIIVLDGIANRGTDIEMILALLQYIGRLGNLAQIIIGGHGVYRKTHGHGLGLAGLQESGLPKGCQLTGRLAQLPLRGTKVDLNHFLAGLVAHVAHIDLHTNGVAALYHLRHGKSKFCIGETVTEGIVYLLSRTGNGLEIAISHIDIVCIVDIVIGLVEIVGGRIILQTLGKGIGQLAAGVAVTDQQFCCCQAALHTALPCHQHGPDRRILLEPLRIDHTAHIHHHDDLGECGLYSLNHCFFSVGQIEISVLEDLLLGILFHFLVGKKPCNGKSVYLALLVIDTLSIPALAGETTDADDRSIGKGTGLLQQIVRNLWLHRHAGFSAHRILLLHIFPVEFCQLFKDADMTRLQGQSLVQIADVGNGHVSASAAALDIVKGCLAEQGKPGSLCQGEQPSLIL